VIYSATQLCLDVLWPFGRISDTNKFIQHDHVTVEPKVQRENAGLETDYPVPDEAELDFTPFVVHERPSVSIQT
jgi:hypothetical protein